ncbi:MAG: hypothetical protein ACE5EO_06355 [Candidatus Krumholzibacteriia bacterium]
MRKVLEEKVNDTRPDPVRLNRRRSLNPLVRYLAIAMWGGLLGVLVSYLLRKAGY